MKKGNDMHIELKQETETERADREDNHVPGGFVRNFWRPVADRFSGYECACVATEPAIVEDKGDFVWRGITP